MPRDPIRNLQWGKGNRPATYSGQVGFPNEGEGSDGDIQIRQTNLGAHLFGKAGGTWYGSPLTATAGDPVTRIGVNLSDHLAIDRDSVDIFTGGVQVAEFGADTVLTGGSITIRGTTGTIGDERLVIENNSVSIYANNTEVFDVTGSEITIGAKSTATHRIIIDGGVGTGSTDYPVIIGNDLVKVSGDGFLYAKSIRTDGVIQTYTDGSWGSTSVAIGYTQSNIGAGNVGIGYNSPNASRGAAAYNVAIGQAALSTLDDGGDNICIGRYAGDAITTGSDNVCIGKDTDAAAGADNQIAIGLGAVASGVNVGIWGNSSIATNNITVDWTVTSDRRIKKDIEDSDIGLSFVNSLKPRQFKKLHPSEWDADILEERYKEGGSNYDDEKNEVIKNEFDEEKVWNGLIAQEVKESMDDLGVEFSGWYEAPDSKQGIQYATLVMPLIKAVQELSAQVDIMQTEINNLKSE